MSFSSIDYWYTEKERLGSLLEKYEAAHDSFSWDDIYPKYQKACEEYRKAVLIHAPFTGVMF